MSERLLRHPRVVVAASALALAAALWGLTRFRLATDLSGFFPRGDPEIELTRRLYGRDAGEGTLLLVLRADDAATIEKALPDAVRALRASPHVEGVIATRSEWAGERDRPAPLHLLSDDERALLRDRLVGPGRRAALEDVRRRLEDDPVAGAKVAQRDPLGVRWLFDEALNRAASSFAARLRPGSEWLLFDAPPMAIVRVTGRGAWSDTTFCQTLMSDVERRLAPSGLRAEYAGAPASSAWHAPRLFRDLRMQVLSSAALVIAFLFWHTRRAVMPFVLVLPVAIAIACALSFGGLALGPLAPSTVAVAAILMAQGIDFPIHFNSRYRDARRTLDADASFAVAYASIGRAQLGAGLTTLAAFLVLAMSRFPGINQFGLLLAIGLALCMLFSLTLLPVIVRRFDRFAGGTSPRPGRIPRPWAAILLVCAAIASWSWLAWRGIGVNLAITEMLPRDDPSRRTLARLEGDLGSSVTPAFALVDGAVPIDELHERAARLAVARCEGPHTLVPSTATRARLDTFRRETDGWVASTLREMERMGFHADRFRPALDELNASLARPAPEPDAYRLDGRWVLHVYPRRALSSPEERRAFDADVRSALGAGVAIHSPGHVTDHESRLLKDDLVRMSALAIAAIAVVSIVAAGGLRRGLLALVPVAVAAGVMLAAQSIVAGPLNLMSMTAIPIVIGIAVDDGIYYMVRRRAPDRPTAERVLADIRPGIRASAITTMLAFGSLAFSYSGAVAALGLLVVLGRFVALATTECILPLMKDE